MYVSSCGSALLGLPARWNSSFGECVIVRISSPLKELPDQISARPIKDIHTTAHSPKGDKAHPRHSVEDERTSHAVRHIPIGWGDECDVKGQPVTTLSSHNPHETQWGPTTTGHEDPPPRSADDKEGPLTPTGPTTWIDKWPRGPTGGHNDRRMANSTIDDSTAPNIPASATSLERRERMHSNVLPGVNAEKTSDNDGESF